MTLALESQGHILFLMVDYVGLHDLPQTIKPQMYQPYPGASTLISAPMV